MLVSTKSFPLLNLKDNNTRVNLEPQNEIVHMNGKGFKLSSKCSLRYLHIKFKSNLTMTITQLKYRKQKEKLSILKGAS